LTAHSVVALSSAAEAKALGFAIFEERGAGHPDERE
jgi:hypothetical protein